MKNLVKSFLTLLTFFVFTSPSWAIELDEATRTLPLNSSKTVTLSLEQVKKGKRLFINTCSRIYL